MCQPDTLPAEAFHDPKGILIASSHYEVQQLPRQEVQLNIQL
jgi:hypothetical protein